MTRLRATLFSIAFSACAGLGWAGPPDPSCRENGCMMGSDQLVFNRGGLGLEIRATILACGQCSAPAADGSFNITDLDFELTFGPYDPALCDPGPSRFPTHVGSFDVVPHDPDLTAPDYVPANPSQVVLAFPPAPLNPNCIHADNLDVEIPTVQLTGADGARTDLQSGAPARWKLPENVRASDVSFVLSDIALDPFPITSSLDFATTQVPPVKLWPDGLPFLFSSSPLAFSTTQVQLLAPTYSPKPPGPGGLPGNPVHCTSPGGGILCTATALSNLGYLDASAWFADDVLIDNDGFDLQLSLTAGQDVVYQPLFPQAVWIELNGPASIGVVDSRIVGGFFSDGRVWVEPDDLGLFCIERTRYLFDLNDGSLRPQILTDGALLAGVTDLTPTGTPTPLAWSYNNVESLGCGTLYTPPAFSEVTPQANALASAVPTSFDRGIYAGVNYNRNRICRDSSGANTDTLCVQDSDCAIALGETCEDGGFSPLCPALASVPRWYTRVEGINPALNFDIQPELPGTAEREMAFVMRRSGITGVFDGGDDPFTVGGGGATFEMEFERFGLAFLGSQSERGDTISSGGLVSQWPADTRVPFEELRVCNCGAYDEARTPDTLIEKELRYWRAPFTPYGLTFHAENLSQVDCVNPAGNQSCSSSQSTQSVCIEATTPVPRYEPDFTSMFSLGPTGDAGDITPLADARLAFDEAKIGIELDPFTHDITRVGLEPDWNGTPTRPQVLGGSAPYGFYDVEGELDIPLFGLTESAMKIQYTLADATYLPDMHEIGLLGQGVVAERVLGADSLRLPFKVDYIRPDTTTEADGNNLLGQGRGALFAFPEGGKVNLGAVEAAVGMILKPELNGPGQLLGGDIGPAGITRLAGSVNDVQALAEILPPDHLSPFNQLRMANALNLLGAQGQGHTLPDPPALQGAMHASGAIDSYIGNCGQTVDAHPDYCGRVDVGNGPGQPPMDASKITGYLTIPPSLDAVDFFLVNANLDTRGEFFQTDGALLTVDRHVKATGQPIIQFQREALGDAGNTMQLPGDQNIPYPSGGGAKSAGKGNVGGSPFPGFTWDFDYTVNTSVLPPTFEFNSLTGTLDLTAGGLGGIAFDELGATLKFYADGDWYFDAGMSANVSGYGVKAGFVTGNTKTLDPLRGRDPDAADFLGDLNAFKGIYLGAGFQARIFNYGCPFTVSAGTEVGAWVLSGAVGGKWKGWMSGTGACLVSIRGDLTLMAGAVNDKFKLQGNLWLAGGIGFCDPEDWHRPADVLDDDFCAACVLSGKMTGSYPPKSLNLKFSGPDVDCSL